MAVAGQVALAIGQVQRKGDGGVAALNYIPNLVLRARSAAVQGVFAALVGFKRHNLAADGGCGPFKAVDHGGDERAMVAHNAFVIGQTL